MNNSNIPNGLNSAIASPSRAGAAAEADALDVAEANALVAIHEQGSGIDG